MREWKIGDQDNLKILNLPQYPAFILKLLALRGLVDEEKIRDFLDPDYNKLHDPFLFKDMQKAADRIWKAIGKQEQVTIYADYDADAITAASVVFLALKKAGAKVAAYIPDRFTEGYGLNPEAIGKIGQTETKLIITVDCGTNAAQEAKLCQELGIDLIITDHHEITGELPKAFALINPKNPADNYAFSFLTGVGVAYKLVQALSVAPTMRSGQPAMAAGWEKWLLDLVAIGTVADCQSLTGENRILVSFGLKVLKKTKWPGLSALMKVAGVNPEKIDAFALGFLLAPRINAAGRIAHANAAFELLTSQNPSEAEAYALQLNDLNQHRQMLTQQILSEAKAQVEMSLDKKVLVACGDNWPKGVVGLVAGKLAEEYCRPVLVLEKGEVYATGSGRSAANFDLVAALNFCKDHLYKYGGHTQAAGFTLTIQNLDLFHQKMLEYAESINYVSSPAAIELDAVIKPSDLNWTNFDFIQQFGPFGYGNHKPKFASYGLNILDYRLVGNASQHLKMKLGLGQHTLDAIAFNQGFLASKLTIGGNIDAAFELSANEWNGNKSLELKILDIKLN
ncbi:MAG: single-stranded-DNA-specific exonuclease RecJ [Candidatus Doudnabacteria bacterium]|nr:single-stranded-DNA-specific exonuclease RecJ [Candidatus Doudnabacteria bacterium]